MSDINGNESHKGKWGDFFCCYFFKYFYFVQIRFCVNSVWLLCDFCVNSVRILCEFCVNFVWIFVRFSMKNWRGSIKGTIADWRPFASRLFGGTFLLFQILCWDRIEHAKWGREVKYFVRGGVPSAKNRCSMGLLFRKKICQVSCFFGSDLWNFTSPFL